MNRRNSPLVVSRMACFCVSIAALATGVGCHDSDGTDASGSDAAGDADTTGGTSTASIYDQTAREGLWYGTYHIAVAKHSGKAIDIPAQSSTAGVAMQQFTNWGPDGPAFQQWTAVPTHDGCAKVVSRGNKFVLLHQGAAAAGAAIIQMPWTQVVADQLEARAEWNYQDLGGGYYRINACANPNLVVQVQGNLNTADYAKIVLGEWKNSDDQKWSKVAVPLQLTIPDPTTSPWIVDNQLASGSLYFIRSKYSGIVFNMSGNSQKSGTLLVQYRQEDWENEKYQLVYAEGDYFKIIPNHSGKAIEVKKYDPALETGVVKSSWLSGTRVIQSFWNNKDSQKFKIIALADDPGWVKFESKQWPGKVIQLRFDPLKPDDSKGDGAPMAVEDWTGADYQKFRLERLSDMPKAKDIAKAAVAPAVPAVVTATFSPGTPQQIMQEYIKQIRTNALLNGLEDWGFDIDVPALFAAPTQAELEFVTQLNLFRTRESVVANTEFCPLLQAVARLRVRDQYLNSIQGHWSEAYNGVNDIIGNLYLLGMGAMQSQLGGRLPGHTLENYITAAFTAVDAIGGPTSGWGTPLDPGHRNPMLDTSRPLIGFATSPGNTIGLFGQVKQ